jgi:hypothetical protein
MWRRLTASALFGLALLTLTATGQYQPPKEKPAEKKAADPLDGLIAAALANDPEVRIARAKTQLADAELAKARQLVTQKVLTLNAQIQEQKRVEESAAQLVVLAEQRAKAGAEPAAVLIEARRKLEDARARLAQLTTELKLMTGGDKAAPPNPVTTEFVVEGILVRVRPIPAGPVPDRLRAALDKKVKFSQKGEERVFFGEALDVFKKQGGLDVAVQGGSRLSAVAPDGQELPIGAWLQLFADATPDCRILVREYGLLVTEKASAPPDAVSVFDFWKQKPAGVPPKQ